MSSYSTKRRRVNKEVQKNLNFIRGTCPSALEISETISDDIVNKSLDPQVISVQGDDNIDNVSEDSISSTDSTSSNESLLVETDQETTLTEKIRLWSINHNVTHKAVNDLLSILRESTVEGSKFPKDCRTLLKTPRIVNIKPIAGGSFVYFGISYTLSKLSISSLKKCKYPFLQNEENLISVTIGIDGLPLSRSSNVSFWPILARIDQIKNYVFVVGIYLGSTKPLCIKEYLNDFIQEVQLLQADGVIIENKQFSFKLTCAIADAPARSFIKQCKQHNAFNGCERCVQQGTWDGRVIFLETKSRLRTDASFAQLEDPSHHNGLSPLTSLSFGLVTQVPLDYMHLVCLGAVRKLLYTWTFGKVPHKWPSRQVDLVSSDLINIKPYIPCEFARKTRSLRELKHFKATEYRTFLLYTGVVVLYRKIPLEQYKLFLKLHCSMMILLGDKAHIQKWNRFGNSLLLDFVSECRRVFGRQYLVYNIHSLIHLADDALLFGSLDNISAFEFENYMQKIKRMVRKQERQLAQVAKRIEENNVLSFEPIEGSNRSIPISNEKTFKYTYNGIVISVNKGNNCFIINSGSTVLIDEIIYSSISSIVLKCKELVSGEYLGHYPCESVKLGIRVFHIKKYKIIDVSLTDLVRKCVWLPYDKHLNKYICIPYTKNI